MIVVSNTSPLCYLVLIGEVSLLHRLYNQINVPVSVIQELLHPQSPADVQKWASNPPIWLQVHARTTRQPIPRLHQGESDAIRLADNLSAGLLFLDDSQARKTAIGQGFKVSDVLGVLLDAKDHGFIKPESVIEKLLQTNFRISRKVLDQFF